MCLSTVGGASSTPGEGSEEGTGSQAASREGVAAFCSHTHEDTARLSVCMKRVSAVMSAVPYLAVSCAASCGPAVAAGRGRGRCFQEGATGCTVEGVRVPAGAATPTRHTVECVTGLPTHTTTYPIMHHCHSVGDRCYTDVFRQSQEEMKFAQQESADQ